MHNCRDDLYAPLFILQPLGTSGRHCSSRCCTAKRRGMAGQSDLDDHYIYGLLKLATPQRSGLMWVSSGAIAPATLSMHYLKLAKTCPQFVPCCLQAVQHQ